MPHKIESLFERTTGINPKLLEPQPTAQYMQKAIRAARKAVGGGGDDKMKTLFEISKPPIFFVEQVENTVEGPFSVIGRVLNGATEYAILFETGLGDENVQRVGPSIPSSDWFTLDQASL